MELVGLEGHHNDDQDDDHDVWHDGTKLIFFFVSHRDSRNLSSVEIFRHASVSSTAPGPLVVWLVILSDFHSVSISGPSQSVEMTLC